MPLAATVGGEALAAPRLRAREVAYAAVRDHVPVPCKCCREVITAFLAFDTAEKWS